MRPIISVENLGKKYVLSHQAPERYTTLRDVLASRAKRLSRKLLRPSSAPDADPRHEEFWALKDISFEIQQGDRVGIIGRNGAGKSTLLKILSRITEPSTGRVKIKGRVASLLEVGTGFHPELSGRENIYLNGAILGMSKADISRRFDEIVAFAEIEKFLDTPVKRYSSGMYVRLAFAVAAHLEPEILVVDEVLAVGDSQFQKKCMGKMENAGKDGRTILFVSHNMQAVMQLCDRALVLKGGSVVIDGSVGNAVESYLGESSMSMSGRTLATIIDELPVDPSFQMKNVFLYQNGRLAAEIIESKKPLEILIEYEVRQETTGLRVYFDLCDDQDTILFRTFHDEDNDSIPTMKKGRYVSRAVIPGDLLGPRSYRIRIMAGVYNVRSCLPASGITLPIRVENTGRYNRAYLGDTFRGQLALVVDWQTKRIDK